MGSSYRDESCPVVSFVRFRAPLQSATTQFRAVVEVEVIAVANL
jgi:hypothetical protein